MAVARMPIFYSASAKEFGWAFACRVTNLYMEINCRVKQCFITCTAGSRITPTPPRIFANGPAVEFVAVCVRVGFVFAQSR